MTRSQSMRFLLGLALLALVMAAQALIPSGADETILVGAILDAGHVPLFAVFALVVLWLSRSTVPGTGARHYLIVLALVVIAGLGTEFIQKFSARDAGWGDFGRDLLGGSAAVLVAFAMGAGRGWRRILAFTLAVVLLAVGVAELGRVYLDYRGRDASFPSLAGFDATWEPRFVHGHDADIDLVVAGGEGMEGRAAKVTFRPAAYPSLSIREPFPDWTDFSVMELVVRNERDTPVEFWVRIHDAAHDETYADRFNARYVADPGTHRLTVPLEQVAKGPRDRDLDLATVAGIAFFVDHPDEGLELWFDEIRLAGE